MRFAPSSFAEFPFALRYRRVNAHAAGAALRYLRANGVVRTAAWSKPLLLAAAAFALAGCTTPYVLPKVDVAGSPNVRPQPMPAPEASNGSIYQASAYRPLFEDHRARLVGDTLTVQIVEKVSASQKSTSSIDKSGTIGGGVTALPGVRAAAFARASVEGSSANKFEGKGSTENTNDFSGTVTSVVTEVLPNGHLLITGEKQIGVNQNVDVLRFSGQVDPRSIQPGNVVQSAQIANVRIDHRGRGAQADANGIGWLGRFFLNVMPF
ncbi:MAG: flagellar basal body L-ring protein FlgH [Rhizobacter sp.]|nr:flagellar basal body L-ring protein FlgH [Rhizobacter sp.]